MRTKLIIAGVILLLVLAGGLAAFWPFGNGNVLRLPGVVEIQEVRLGSKVGGRVEAIFVNEGDVIDKRSQPLVVFEAPELKNQWKQMKARLDGAKAEWQRAENGPREEERKTAHAAMEAAKARWDRTEFGWRKEEKEQAESELRTAEADFEQALKEFNRIAPLWLDKAVSKTEYEAALASRDRARGRKEAARWRDEMMKAGSRKEDKIETKQEYERAKYQYELLRQGTRQEDKDMAKAKVDELQAMLEAIEINLKETSIYVPPNLGKAKIEVIAFRPGDLVQPNQSVIRVLRVEDMWVKVYVPETELGKIKPGHRVNVTIDSYPGKNFKGTVIQHASIAEFTPRNVQSVDERRHQVFGIKIHIEDPQGSFHAGMAAEVVFPLDQ